MAFSLQSDLCQIGSEISALIFSENTQRKAYQRPQMNSMISSAIMLGQIMDLRMAVMARSYTVSGAGILYLLVFQFSIGASCFRHTRLEKAPSAAAAVVVRSVRRHINIVLFADNGFNHKPQIFSNRVPKTLANQLAWILNSKLGL